MTTYVCSFKDIECGANPENWCGVCPQWQLKTKSIAPATKSQEVFEKKYAHISDLTKSPTGVYTDVLTYCSFELWDMTWEVSRKQALEQLKEIYHRTYPSIEAQLAAIKELMK
jgi:hypothetical protein